ncbi:hypothetical protein ACXIZN_04170 [Amycolatopsis sp. TRM77291]
MFAVVVDHDGELDGFEQGPQVRFWRRCEVCREIGKRIDQRHFIGCHSPRRCRVRLVQGGDLRLELFFVLGQFVVAASQCGRKGVVRVPLLCLLQDRCLLLGDLGELSLDPGSFFLSFSSGVIVGTGQVGFEDRATVRTEHAVGEELGDGVEQGVFSKVESVLVVGEPVRAAAVVVAGPAEVVRPVVPRYTDQTPAATMEQPPPEQIGPGGGWMRARCLCVA